MPLTDALPLPSEVRRRLASAPTVNELVGRSRGLVVERRRASRAPRPVELRATLAGPELDGYATVYGIAYDVAGGPERYGWSETFELGACATSVAAGDDVRLLFDHDGLPLARTAPGTLELVDDPIGLRVAATLDPASPYVQSVASAMRRGDADQMSLAFRVTDERWNSDYTERTIRGVQLFDVSVVTFPANPSTVAHLRSGRAGPPPALAAALAAVARARA